MAGKENEQERIRSLLKIHPKGLTIEEVSQKLSLNRATAAKYLNSLVMSGQADLRNLGPAKLFSLTQRLPLTNLLSLASDLILIMDSDAFVREVNDRFLQVFQIPRDVIKGVKIEHSPLGAYFSADHIAAMQSAIDGTDRSLDVDFTTNGEQRYFRMKCMPLVFDEGGHGAGMILEDITEMKKYQHELEERVRERTARLEETNNALEHEVQKRERAQIELEQNQQFIQRIIDTTPNLIYIYDLGRKSILYMNSNTREILGYTEEQLRAMGSDFPKTLVHPDDLGKIKEHYTALALMMDDTISDCDYRLRHADGHWIMLRSRDVIFNRGPDGLGTQVIGTAEDITEKRRAEDAIQRATKQLILLNSITRHDILNQLTTLSGYLSMMQKIQGSEQLAEVIRKEKETAETIRRQITFTRDYQNIGIQPPHWVNIRDLVTRMAGPVKGSVSVAINTGNLEIFADFLIEKVFFNLIENSLRHGGTVSAISIGYRRESDEMVIVYEDDGTGVPADEKDLIFERGHGKNTGYGLFLAREILAITNLSIRETGVPGAGARFEILVPAHSFRFPGEQNGR